MTNLASLVSGLLLGPGVQVSTMRETAIRECNLVPYASTCSGVAFSLQVTYGASCQYRLT